MTFERMRRARTRIDARGIWVLLGEALWHDPARPWPTFGNISW